MLKPKFGSVYPASDENHQAVQKMLAQVNPPGPSVKPNKKKRGGKSTPPQPSYSKPSPQPNWGRSPADVARKPKHDKKCKKNSGSTIRPSRHYGKSRMTQHGVGASVIYMNDQLIQRIFGSSEVHAIHEQVLCIHQMMKQKQEVEKIKDEISGTLPNRVVADRQERRRWRRKFFFS